MHSIFANTVMRGDHSNGYTALTVSIVACGCAVFFIYQQAYVYAISVLPVFLIDLCVSKHNRNDLFVNIFKLFLLCQGVGLWYMNSTHLFDSSAARIQQEALLFNKQFDWQNMQNTTTTLLRGIGQRTFDTLVDNLAPSQPVRGSIGHTQYEGRLFPVQVVPASHFRIHSQSVDLLNATFGELPGVNFPDLRYHSKAEVQAQFPVIFSELPRRGFDSRFKNPCWKLSPSQQVDEIQEQEQEQEQDAEDKLVCLPYAYILGQPKSGTSDLFERMKGHGDIIMPTRKEVRWFTRGEFSRTALLYEGSGPTTNTEGTANAEGGVWEGVSRGEKLLGTASSILTFTKAFRDLAAVLQDESEVEEVAQTLVTIDGGPHTLWWPTQSPDGAFLHDIPAPQIIREIQPDAKFLITLTDPVKRLYSDYYFLHDNLKPLRHGMSHNKSAEEFHYRVKQQIEQYHACVHVYMSKMRHHADPVRLTSEGVSMSSTMADSTRNSSDNIGSVRSRVVSVQPGDKNFALWFRAAQMCAHDRHTFGAGGWGRLSIGLYVLFIEKWLEHFAPEQFLVLRLEDYESDPKQYMGAVFSFLGLNVPEDWTDILRKVHFNSHRVARDPLWAETETLLRDFYRPFNLLLSHLMDNPGFRWDLPTDLLGRKITLRDALLKEEAHKSADGTKVVSRAERAHRVAEIAKEALHKHEPASEAAGDMKHHDERSYKAGDAQKGHVAPADAGDNLDSNHEQDQDQAARDRAMQKTWGKYRATDSQRNAKNRVNTHLRGGSKAGATVRSKSSKSADVVESPAPVLIPHSFSLDGLVLPSKPFTEDDAIERNLDLSTEDSAASALCGAAFTLDLAQLQYLLYDQGIPANLASQAEAHRTAMHCLTLLFTLGDAHSMSHVFSALKGAESWLNPHFHPPYDLLHQSVLSRDITSRLQADMLAVAQWLQRAGTSVSDADISGFTPLHFASMGGETGLVTFFMEHGADVNAVNRDKRSPLHFAVALGHAKVASLLIEKGADWLTADARGMRPLDIISNPGPIYPADATAYFNVTQREARQIQRYLHPEQHPHEKGGWPDGGWSTERLKGFETNMSCDGIDQYWADEISEADVLDKYLARNTPVMIRGLLNDWKIVKSYQRDTLLAEHGDLNVQVSDIPYADKFGGTAHVDKTLGEYITEVREHRMVGGNHPWYVFKGNVIPLMSDADDSLVKIKDCPTPPVLQRAFEKTAGANMRGRGGVEGRKIFVNAQWALGGEGTGAPVHFHNTAWAALIYGAKYWVIYPPHDMIMSNKQMLDYFETDLHTYAARGINPMTCVQTAGDVLIIPESWGHGVLNIQESVAMATEAKNPLFRMSPGTKLFNKYGAAPERAIKRISVKGKQKRGKGSYS